MNRLNTVIKANKARQDQRSREKELEKDWNQEDYQLNYGVNQKKRAIERVKQLLSEIKEIPTETYEYAYYSFNNALERFESEVSKMEGYAEDEGHNDESGWETDDEEN